MPYFLVLFFFFLVLDVAVFNSRIALGHGRNAMMQIMRILNECSHILMKGVALAPLVGHHEFLTLFMERRDRIDLAVDSETLFSTFVEWVSLVRLSDQMHQLRYFLLSYCLW